VGGVAGKGCWELGAGFVVGEIQVCKKMCISFGLCGGDAIIIVLLVPLGVYSVFC